MTAIDFQLENGVAQDEKTGISVVVNCANGIDRPHWSLIEDGFYDGLSSSLVKAATVGPVFHVKAEALEQASPFSVHLQLEHAVFAAGQNGNPATPYDSTHKDLGHVTVTGNERDRTRARVTWTGIGVARRNEGWSRWIVRLYLEDEGTPARRAPIYLGFTCMWNEKRSELRDKLKRQHTLALPANASFTSIPQAAHKLSIRIDVEGEGEPRFPDLFRPRDQINLPDHVYLEPLIVIRKSEELIDLEFTSDDGILFPSDPSQCNPSMGGREPLATAWLGVTNPKVECRPPENEPVSRGFVGSWIEIEPKPKRAVVRWQEPKDEDTAKKRIASFFFVKESVIGGGSPSASLQFRQTLIDPTVVYDKDDPPKG